MTSALKHGLSPEYIKAMWTGAHTDGFEVRRLAPKESNIIVIRFVQQSNGTLEMLAEDRDRGYYVFHAQLVKEGHTTTLLREAFALLGLDIGR